MGPDDDSGRAGGLERPLDDATLRALPIFPLREAVLLPRSLVPLHVFEPRYVAMARDVLGGAGVMAIARLLPGFEATYHGRPPVASTIGIGRVVAAEDAPGGRINLVLAGVARAAIERELPPTRSYREVEARVLPDAPPADALRARTDQLIAVCDRLAVILPAGGDELRKLCRIDHDASMSCDRVAGLLVTDADARQALLEELDPLVRAEALVEHASHLLIALSKPPAGPLN
jgi:Lon protease-like protein